MYKLIKKLADICAINKVKNLKDFSKIEKVVSKKKNKPVILTREEVLSVYNYIYSGLFLEIFVMVVIIILSVLLKIFTPTIAILIPFLMFRLIFKGNHLNGYYKCLVFTTGYIILAAYVSNLLIPYDLNLLLKLILYISIGLGLELISLMKWFNKVLDFINKYKLKTS